MSLGIIIIVAIFLIVVVTLFIVLVIIIFASYCISVKILQIFFFPCRKY